MTRARLPGRRAAVTFDVEHAGYLYTVTAGAYVAGAIGEVFVTPRLKVKSGSLVEAWARDSAILLSLALQHGCSLETIRAALTRGTAEEAAGPIGEICDALAELQGPAAISEDEGGGP